MSHALQQHGRGIAASFTGVTYHQGADCGELVSELPTEAEDGLSRTERIGIALALLVLLIGGAVAVGG